MFNFTTQTIYNELTKAVVGNNGKMTTKGNLIVNETNTPYVRVGNTRFDDCSIISVEKKLPSEEIKASVSFDLAKFSTALTSYNSEWSGKTVGARVAFYIGLTPNSQDSYYSNSLVYKGKPLYVEFPFKVGDGEAASATKLQKLAEQVFVMSDEPILTVTVNSKIVTFTCVNGYQIIREAKLQVFDPNLNSIDCCNADGGFYTITEAKRVIGEGVFAESNNLLQVASDDITWKDEDGEEVEDTTEVIFPGAEAFGNYDWIMHNLRIPTCANTSYWGLSSQMGELPAAGGNYIQYTIRMKRESYNISGESVGAALPSVTTHVLYVKNNAVGISDLENALTTLKDVYGSAVVIRKSADALLTGSGTSVKPGMGNANLTVNAEVHYGEGPQEAESDGEG